MTILRPPITGDVQLDSWMNEVSNSVGTGAALGGSFRDTGLPGAGDTAVNAVTLVLYKRWSADIMPFAQEITVQTVYKYSTTTLTNSVTQSTANFDGWYRAVPDLTDGAYLYAIQVNIADRGDIEIISFDNWSPPTLIADNTEAVDGFNTATVNLFQRTTGATPTNPQGTLTYTFETSEYVRSITNDGWTTLENVGTGGTLWISSAVASSRTSTHVIPSTEWHTTKLSVNGSNGVAGIDGTNGVSTALLNVYLRSASTPTTPTGGSFNFTGTVLTPPSGWSIGIETGTNPVYISRGIASVVGQTATDSSIAWSPPELAYQNGDDGTQGSSFFEGFAFKRAATQPATPTGGSFNFGTNILTPPSGWYVDIPSGTDPAWLITGNFSVVGSTGIDNSTTWTAPTKSFDNGIDGVDGTDGISVYLFSVFKRSATTISAPTGGSYNFGTNVGTAPSGWSVDVPSGTDPVYRSTTTATIAGATGVDNSLTWGAPVLFVKNGVDGGTGAAGPRNASGYIYYSLTATSAPATPTASSYVFTTGSFSGLTANWSRTPPAVSGGDLDYWATSYYVSEATLGGTQTIVFSTPFSSFSFDGLVTFQNLNNELANPVGSQITTIDGGLLKTGTIDADVVTVANLNASNISSGTINSARLNVDTLNVKYLEDVDTKIYDHNGTARNLTLEALNYVQKGTGGTAYQGIVPITLTGVRDGARYLFFFSGVLGDITGWKVQISTNGTTWTTASGGNPSITWNANTYRGYTYAYTGTASIPSGSSTLYARVYTGTLANYTYAALNGLVFNTG